MKKKYTKEYTIIDNAVLQCDQLSIEARGAYAYCFSLPEDWEFSIFRVAKAFNCGVERATRIINELIEFGLLEKEVWHNEKGHKKVSYTLYDMGNRIVNPYKENPYSENPYKGNQDNNKIINDTKEENYKEINSQNPPTPKSESKGESNPRLEVIKESFQKTKELYKQVKPSANDLIFQKAEQEFFRIVRNRECPSLFIVDAMRKQVELWDYKLKEDAKAIKYIPRLENWLERRAFFEDFDKLLEPYKSKGNQQARGGVGYGDPQAQDGYLIDILKGESNA